MEHTFKFANGEKVIDTITGFQGTVTGRCSYLFGSDTFCVTPAAKNPNEFQDGRWLDGERLEVVTPPPIA